MGEGGARGQHAPPPQNVDGVPAYGWAPAHYSPCAVCRSGGALHPALSAGEKSPTAARPAHRAWGVMYRRPPCCRPIRGVLVGQQQVTSPQDEACQPDRVSRPVQI